MADGKEDRNPLIVPQAKPARRGCPKCGAMNFVGFNRDGTILFKCREKDCNESWAGGINYYASDPLKIDPPLTYTPPVSIVPSNEGKPMEVRRKVDLTPDFRQGKPIKGEE